VLHELPAMHVQGSQGIGPLLRGGLRPPPPSVAMGRVAVSNTQCTKQQVSMAHAPASSERGASMIRHPVDARALSMMLVRGESALKKARGGRVAGKFRLVP